MEGEFAGRDHWCFLAFSRLVIANVSPCHITTTPNQHYLNISLFLPLVPIFFLKQFLESWAFQRNTLQIRLFSWRPALLGKRKSILEQESSEGTRLLTVGDILADETILIFAYIPFSPRHWTDLGLGLVSVWVCEGGPSSPWEQPGWARHYCLHGACSHLALDGALRETQAGANLQKTLPACLIMRMTCSSIPPLRVRAATMFPWSCDTFAAITWTTYCVASVHSYYCAVQFWVWKWYNEMFQRISKTTGCVIFR